MLVARDQCVKPPYNLKDPRMIDGRTFTYEQVTLNLPPAASPYVMILEGISHLMMGKAEDFNDLHNKVLHWLTANTRFRFCDISQILMV